MTCDTTKATRSKGNKSIQFGSHEVLSMLRAIVRHQPSPLKLLSGYESVHFWMEELFCFSTKSLSFAAGMSISFHITMNSPRLYQIQKRSNSEPFDRFEAGSQLNAGVLSQSVSSIMLSWLPKVPLWLRKCHLSQPPSMQFVPLPLRHQTTVTSAKWSICPFSFFFRILTHFPFRNSTLNVWSSQWNCNEIFN